MGIYTVLQSVLYLYSFSSVFCFVTMYREIIEQPFMLPAKPLLDPLGNTIQIPEGISEECTRKITEISEVITTPNFMIRERGEKMYFFRLIAWHINMMVEVCLRENDFVVASCQENPSADFISLLLTKGNLISFQ